MSFADLLQKIEQRQAVLGVIGLGYVGLPVACMFADAGFYVIGLDIKGERVAAINACINPIEGDEPGLAELLQRVVASGHLRSTTDYTELACADVITINVETPVDDAHHPQYDALKAACTSLGQVIKREMLVIIESTVAPGTMDHIVRPLLEQISGLCVNRDFYLVACPERVMPGKLLANLQSMARVVGGMCPDASELAVALYRHIVRAELDAADCLTAEIVKTAENAYRDVQIAFANELALICEDLGADVWHVRGLINKSPGRSVLLPGVGVGGHCIPKDPWLLIAQTNSPMRLIPAARAINDLMPLHMADLVSDALNEAGVAMRGAKIAVMGYAYLENSDDSRNTPTEPFVQRLRDLGAVPAIHDPYVREYTLPLDQVLTGADCMAVMVRHRQYVQMDLEQARRLMRTPVLVDGRDTFPHPGGFIWRKIGVRTR